MVKNKLLYQQEVLIDLAIKTMSDSELTSEISCEIYNYWIEKDKKKVK